MHAKNVINNKMFFRSINKMFRYFWCQIHRNILLILGSVQSTPRGRHANSGSTIPLAGLANVVLQDDHELKRPSSRHYSEPYSLCIGNNLIWPVGSIYAHVSLSLFFMFCTLLYYSSTICSREEITKTNRHRPEPASKVAMKLNARTITSSP